MQPRIIFFDAHGGIIDDTDIALCAIRDVFSYFHREPPSVAEYLLALELDGWDMTPQFVRRGIASPAEEIYDLMSRAYVLRLRNAGIILSPGVRKILETEQTKKVLMVLVSRYPEGVIAPFILDAGIASFFGFEIFGEDDPKRPIDWVLKIENMHTTPPILPNECVFISPNPFALFRAKRAGVRTIALIRKPIPPYFPRLAQPDNEVDDPLKILELIAE